MQVWPWPQSTRTARRDSGSSRTRCRSVPTEGLASRWLRDPRPSAAGRLPPAPRLSVHRPDPRPPGVAGSRRVLRDLRSSRRAGFPEGPAQRVAGLGDAPAHEPAVALPARTHVATDRHRRRDLFAAAEPDHRLRLRGRVRVRPARRGFGHPDRCLGVRVTERAGHPAVAAVRVGERGAVHPELGRLREVDLRQGRDPERHPRCRCIARTRRRG
jgi:hypothetical protein